MKIANNKMVSIHYTLTDDNGVELDSSVEGNPLSYIHGNGYLITGLERELEGKEAGEKFSVSIQPEDAYGIYNEQLVATLPKERFDMDGEIEIGMQFQVATPSGPTIVKVTEVNGNSITIDANHDLAGKVLHFDVEVLDVRDLTEEELSQLNSGGCGGGCGGCNGGCSSEGGCNGDCNYGDDGCGKENCNGSSGDCKCNS